MPNYGAFDAEGNLYVCESGEWHADTGMIYRIRPGGETEVWDRRPKEFPNGLCMAPDGGSIYVAMSVNPPRVERILDRGQTGALAGWRPRPSSP